MQTTTTLPLNPFQFAGLLFYAIFTLLANQPHCADNSVFNSDISRGELELYHNLNNLNSRADEVVQKGNTDILVDLFAETIPE